MDYDLQPPGGINYAYIHTRGFMSRKGSGGRSSEESPPQQKDHDEPDAGERSILLHQQLPVDAHRSLSVLLAVFPQAP